MFLGCFSGMGTGPSLVCHKVRGTMTSESYGAKFLPLIKHEISMRPNATLMLDNTPCHKAARTMRNLDGLNKISCSGEHSYLIEPHQVAMEYNERSSSNKMSRRRKGI